MTESASSVSERKTTKPGDGKNIVTLTSNDCLGEVVEIYDSVDTLIGHCIEEIWNEFDDDGNGDLDFEETTGFVKHILVEVGERPVYSDKDFIECFKQFKEGGAGCITKAEMAIFVKKVAGLDTSAEERRNEAAMTLGSAEP